MSKYCGLRVLTVIFSLLSLCHLVEAQLLASDFIINVDFVCPKEPTGIAKVSVETDIPDTIPFAYCRDPFTYYYMDLGATGVYNIDVKFNGSDLEGCIFTKSAAAKIYTIEIYVPLAGGIFTSEDLPHLITCSYEDTGEKKSEPTTFEDSIKPVEEQLQNMGQLGRSDVKLYIEDILGNKITSGVPLGNTIRLVAELIGNFSDEISFQAISCKAIAKQSYYSLLVGGCGDGLVIHKTKGFITTTRKIQSPYFRSFRLRGSSSLAFDCTFAICRQTCDGDSCTNYKKKQKRDVRHVRVLPDGSMRSMLQKDLLVTDDMEDPTAVSKTFSTAGSTSPHLSIRRKIDPVIVRARSTNAGSNSATESVDTRFSFPETESRPRKPIVVQSEVNIGVWIILGTCMIFGLLIVITMVLITRKLVSLLHTLVIIETDKVNVLKMNSVDKISVISNLKHM